MYYNSYDFLVAYPSIRLHVDRMTDAQFHGRCQRINAENVEFSIEYGNFYLARRFYCKPDARVIYLHMIGL